MAGSGSAFALAVLVGLSVLSPWALGGAPAWAGQTLCFVTASCSAGVLAWRSLHRSPLAVAPFWPLAGLVVLGTFQLIPLPPSLHSIVASGSASLWHPAEAAAAAVLGPAWRPISVNPVATRQWVIWTFSSGLLAVLALPALHDRRLARRAAVAVVAGALLVAVYGVFTRVVFGPLLFGFIAVPTVSPFGPFVSKNHFAGYVEMVALLALGLATGLADASRRSAAPLSWVGGHRAGRIVVAFGVSAALALGVLVSQSRGGFVSLAVGGVAFVILRARARHRGVNRTALLAAGSLLVVAALLVALPSDARDRIVSIGSGSPDESGRYRIGVWRDSLRVFAASPLVGQGLGAFDDALPRYKTVAGNLRVGHAENDYLELLADAGVAGWLLLLAGLAFLVKTARGSGAESDRLRRGLSLGAASGLAAIAVHSALDFNLRIPASGITALTLGAFLLAAAPALGDEPRPVGTGSRWVAIGLVALLALMGLDVASWSSVPAQTLAPIQLAASPGDSQSLRVTVAEGTVRAHLGRRPADAEAWVVLAWLRLRAGARDEAIALARYASSLDPGREALRLYAERLQAERGRGPQ